MENFQNRRLELHEILCGLLGSRNAYFQPPESVQIKYDAIVYSRRAIEPVYANNQVYNQRDCYSVTVIYRDPDSELPKKISKLPLCRFDRHYTADNLNHDVFILYH